MFVCLCVCLRVPLKRQASNQAGQSKQNGEGYRRTGPPAHMHSWWHFGHCFAASSGSMSIPASLILLPQSTVLWKCVMHTGHVARRDSSLTDVEQRWHDGIFPFAEYSGTLLLFSSCACASCVSEVRKLVVEALQGAVNAQTCTPPYC